MKKKYKFCLATFEAAHDWEYTCGAEQCVEAAKSETKVHRSHDAGYPKGVAAGKRHGSYDTILRCVVCERPFLPKR